MTATSSIAHGGEDRGTITLLRRELILDPTGKPIWVPLVSGNSFRGLLRRTAEELLRPVLDHPGHIPLPVAHALRSGGSLAKTSREPLSGRRLATLRHLVPHIGVFGVAGGGRIIEGALRVGKVLPHLVETRHLTHPHDPSTPQGGASVFTGVQLESYTRHDDIDTHAAAGLAAQPSSAQPTPLNPTDGSPDLDELDSIPSSTMLFRIETFPAGTTFTTWLHLNHATTLEAAFFYDVLDVYRRSARLGGRAAIGHGDVVVNLLPDSVDDPRQQVDWRDHVQRHRDEALQALQGLQ